VGRVSFTLDVWSDQNFRSHLAMTTHWIAEVEGASTLQLKSALIAFHQLRENHSGKTIARTVVHLLDRAEVTLKVRRCFVIPVIDVHSFTQVGHFTMDNASNNETMMQVLEAILATREIKFNAKDRRIMCFAHIIDLCSGRVVRGAGATNNEVVGQDGFSSSDDDSVTPDPIARAHAAVRAIRGSGKRRADFEGVIKNGNENGWFKRGPSSEVVQLKQLQLLRDVRTRWDSVYQMLHRLREMREVCL
jgi:hypothetical protein